MRVGDTRYFKNYIENSMDWARSELSWAVDGALFLAHKHGNTRGRSGRVWVQLDGQLLVTLVLKPSIKASSIQEDLRSLSMAIALGFLDPLKRFGVKFKWPNDFFAAGKKLGGMLCETVIQDDAVCGFIVGAGFNIKPISLIDDGLLSNVTSLADVCGQNLDAGLLLNEMCESLTTWYMHWKNQEHTLIFENFVSNQVAVGSFIQVHLQSGSLCRGVFEGITETSEMQLQTPLGSVITIPFCLVDYVSL